jgi:hypothetical protein
MMAEENPLVGGLEIVAVAQALGGRGALVVQGHDACGDELGVEAVADGVAARGREYQPDAVDALAAIKCDSTQTDCRSRRNRYPEQATEDFHVL